jgi:fatty-acyl-CoA synthase
MKAAPSRVELSPLNFLKRNAETMGERTAVVHGERRYTWAELEARSNRLASALWNRGIERNDRVAVLCPNTPALLEAHNGVPLAGAILVAINTRLGTNEVAYILEDSGAKILIVDHELKKMVEGVDLKGIETIVVEDTGEDDDPYEQLLASGSEEPRETFLTDESDPISINYTSGTTGKPKGAVYTHRGAYLQAKGVAHETRLHYESVHLWTLPMFHCNGWCLTWGVTAAAATHVCLRKVDPDRIWDLFDAEGVTHYSGAPTIHMSIVNHEKAHPLEQRVTVPTGGSPPSPALLKSMRKLNLHPIHLYGLTETYGPITICEWDPAWDDLGVTERARLKARQGVQYVTSDRVRVVDDDLEDVPADGETMGEIVMRGNNVMKGYFRDEEATAQAFRGGWFHSGDLGVMHPNSYVEVRDRAKDIIISGGENISTIEVESALVRHPDVLEAAVVAIPDEKWGERPKGFVTLRAGATLTSEELIAFSRETLPGFKAPSEIEFGELPKTSTGKVKKFELRERVRRRS